MSTFLRWQRPGMARLSHAYEPGATLSLCQSWVGGMHESRLEPLTKDEACAECWNKAQAKRYRRPAADGPTEPAAPAYYVICRDDRTPSGEKGAYALATRRAFATRQEAETYLAGISTSREPKLLRECAPED